MLLFKDIPLTFVHPFYNDGADRIPLKIAEWEEYPDWVWNNINIILIDDGSNPPLLDHYLRANKPNINLKIYQINEDLRYNLPGAYNLGFHVTETEWVYAFDSDHTLSKDQITNLLTTIESQDNYFYQSSRVRFSNIPAQTAVTTPASGSWLVQKKSWKKIGGLDEDLTGEWSNGWGYWEHDFTSRLLSGGIKKKILQHPCTINEYCRTWFGSDIAHNPQDYDINRSLFNQKKIGRRQHPTDMLRFTWRLAYGQRRI